METIKISRNLTKLVKVYILKNQDISMEEVCLLPFPKKMRSLYHKQNIGESH